jgi:hypothetical protein
MNMPATLEEIERRLTNLERQVTTLRQQFGAGAVSGDTPAAIGARLLRQADQAAHTLANGWTMAIQQIGITGAPLPAEQVQVAIQTCGVVPEENEFSSAIHAMREE